MTSKNKSLKVSLQLHGVDEKGSSESFLDNHHIDGDQFGAETPAAHRFLPQWRQIHWRMAGQQEAW